MVQTKCGFDSVSGGSSGVDLLISLGPTITIDRRMIAGIAGSHHVNVYLAQVHVLALRYTIFGAFAGVDLKAGGQVHSALIGRTFLRAFTMIYEGRTGTVTLSND
jgi:hypothetical protein